MLYRAYILTNDNYVRAPPTIITAPNEREAVEEASHLLDGTAIEIWCGNRLVARLEPAARPVGEGPAAAVGFPTQEH
jgi:hypothetical protein